MTPPIWTPRTVRGRRVSAAAYDTVLAHEHIVFDGRPAGWFDGGHELAKKLKDVKVGPETEALVRQHPFACLDNMVMEDPDVAVAELSRLPDPARTLVIDLTCHTIHGNPPLLAEVSARSGVDIVSGAGTYIAPSWSDEFRAMTVDQLAAVFVDALRDPQHPAGVIGEIGTGDTVTPEEQRGLRAAAAAHHETGAPVFVHLHPWAPQGHAALDLLEKEGMDLSRVSLCHLEVRGTGDFALLRGLLERGAWIAFDIWGDEDAYGGAGMPTDAQRLDALMRVIEAGYGDRITHSQDVCTKTQMHTWNGAGYDHLPRHLPGWLRERGLDERQVHAQLAGNALAFIGADTGEPAPVPEG